MDYFKILNLKKEPFSNSPEPEFFYQSVKHLGCLQKLELAIRLRRGLSVVVGDVGTGKTTLCRQLILKFADSEEDRNQIETHLLLDPSFTNPLEFLSTVAITFGVSGAAINVSEWQLKENIKNYLFKKGIEEGKIVVLIVDEGQKLPDFCMEILREFLNYETNEYKLLQIVIFAQSEFERILKEHRYFADRVNFYYLLKPLNFRETRGMVKFRLEKAGDKVSTPSLFTFLGLWALYLATGGYPRKIVTLCHQVILALIIQNRSRAGWFLVRSCSRRVSAGRRNALTWVPVTSLAIVLIFLALVGLYPERILGIKPVNESSGVVRTQEIASPIQNVSSNPAPTSQKPVIEAVATPHTVIQTSQKPVPGILGKLEMKKGRTVWWMLNDFYGDFDRGKLRAVSLANPHIKNLSRVKAGERVTLPAIPAKSNPFPSGKFWVQLASGENIDEMYELYKHHETTVRTVRFLPYWNGREGLVFSIFLKDGYPDMQTALAEMQKLPHPISDKAKVSANFSEDTIFFTEGRIGE
jgi:general secretion pathway protein A